MKNVAIYPHPAHVAVVSFCLLVGKINPKKKAWLFRSMVITTTTTTKY